MPDVLATWIRQAFDPHGERTAPPGCTGWALMTSLGKCSGSAGRIRPRRSLARYHLVAVAQARSAAMDVNLTIKADTKEHAERQAAAEAKAVLGDGPVEVHFVSAEPDLRDMNVEIYMWKFDVTVRKAGQDNGSGRCSCRL